jgi:hypothetical protein
LAKERKLKEGKRKERKGKERKGKKGKEKKGKKRKERKGKDYFIHCKSRREIITVRGQSYVSRFPKY